MLFICSDVFTEHEVEVRTGRLRRRRNTTGLLASGQHVHLRKRWLLEYSRHDQVPHLRRLRDRTHRLARHGEQVRVFHRDRPSQSSGLGYCKTTNAESLRRKSDVCSVVIFDDAGSVIRKNTLQTRAGLHVTAA